MKSGKLKVVICFLFIIIGNFIFAEDCDGNWGTETIGSNVTSVPVATDLDDIYTCGTWDDRSLGLYFQLEIGGITYNSTQFGAGWLSSDLLTFNMKQIVLNLSESTLWSTVKNYENWKLTVKTYFQKSWQINDDEVTVIYNIKIPAQVTAKTVLCSGVPYTYSDLILSAPSSYNSGSITFIDGGGYTGLTQTLNYKYHYHYICNINGNSCVMPIVADIHELKVAYFTTTPQASGVVTAQSLPTPMSSYIYYNGGTLEYSGPGLLLSGGVMKFDPSIANNNSNLMNIRTNNSGCISAWQDTVFYVTPIVTSINTPYMNFQNTFGTGHYGDYNITNPDGTPVVLPGFFHFGCSNKNYTFTFSSNQSNLTYDWKAIYRQNLYASGTGNVINITMPDREMVDENFHNSLAAEEDIAAVPFDPTLLFNSMVVSGYPTDLSGDGVVGQEEQIISGYTGEHLDLYYRATNSVGTSTNWMRSSIGLIKTPVVDTVNSNCYNNLVSTDPPSLTPVYLDQCSSARTAYWDFNNDTYFDFISKENSSHLFTSSNKTDLINVQLVDSAKMYGYNSYTNQWYSFYSPRNGTTCSSDIKSVRLVKAPDPIISFNATGTLQVGSYVLGVVTGNYFNPDVDTIKWNWNDGSPSYYGDSLFHYLNDLGYYDLNISIKDQYGCHFDTLYSQHWFTPGVLSVSEINSNDELVNVYPVPVVNKLTINTDKELLELLIIDMKGKTVIKEKEKLVDLSELNSGIYYVKLTFVDGVVTKKISKL